jgi:hypothetical protein
MTLLAALGALAFLAAALSGLLAPSRIAVARVLAGLGAAALLPSLESAASWPALAVAVGGAALASPLPCLLASASAFALGLRSLAEGPADVTGAGGPAVAAAAAAVALGALEPAFGARLRAGADTAWAGLAGGVLLVGALLRLGKGSLLRWSLAFGDGSTRLPLRGAALVLGLALIALLLGVLALGAHRLAPATAWARILGQRTLLLGAGLTFLGVGLAVARGSGRSPEALAAGSGPLAALLFGATVLTAGLLLMLGAAGGAATGPFGSAGRDGRQALALALALLALAVGGYEAWQAVGSYDTPRTAALGAAVLLGLAARQEARFEMARQLAFLAALLVI